MFGLRSQHSRQGSTFLSAALFAGILAILTAGILGYLRNEYLLNLQGHQWNQALHLSEAGIESALAELNYWYYQDGTGFQSSRGWTTISAGFYSKTVSSFTNGNGKVIGAFTVTITNGATFNPIITSVGTATNTVGRAPVVSRAVRATVNQSSLFPVGLMSKSFLDMKGNNVYTDSYDSTDITKSTGGLYDAAKKQANGNIASNGTVKNTVNVGNADIYGVAYTGFGGTVALGPGGSIGPTFITADRDTTASSAQADGYIQSDFNVDVSDVVLPSGASSWPGAPSSLTTGSGVGGITKSGTLPGGTYRTNKIQLASSDTVIISGSNVVYVTGDVSISGNAKITINAGASLTLYIAGSVSIAGNGVANNSTTPIKNQWYGLSTSTSWSVTGNGDWIGTIYAPNADVSFKGGGSSGDASGGVVANTITLTGNAKFHYDESLRQSNTGSGYAVVSWLELTKAGSSWQ